VPVIRRARAVDRTRLRDREGFLAWAFLLPTVVYLTALVVAPFGLTVAFAFSRSTSAAPSYRFGGLRDFRRILGDHVFRRSLADTLALTGVVIVMVVLLGTVLAHVLLADLRFRRTVRVLVLLPWTTPVALSAISWRWLLGSPGSAADRLLRAASLLHGDGSPLTRTPSAAVAVAAVHVWRLTPLAAVIMMAGLAAIPRGVRDAAHLDGAGFWRRLFGVTVPLTLPATAVAALVAAVATFADLAVVRVLTGGGPRDSTQVLSGLAYARGVEDGDVGGGAATALFLLPLFLAGVYLTARVVRRARGRS
jgi:multiple sugar transport system permease protein